jgi:hypothetical protein
MALSLDLADPLHSRRARAAVPMRLTCINQAAARVPTIPVGYRSAAANRRAG